MIVVRHGLMLVGPTGGGKSSNLHVLEETLTRLKQMGQEVRERAYIANARNEKTLYAIWWSANLCARPRSNADADVEQMSHHRRKQKSWSTG